MKNINLIALLSLVFLLSACQRELQVGCLKPDGDVETRTLNFDDFSKLSIDLPSTLSLTQGDEHEVTIEASSNIIDRINSDSRKSGDELDLEINGCVNLGSGDDIIINVTLPSLEEIKIDGLVDVSGTNTFTLEEDFLLKIDGAATVELEIESTDLVELDIDGASEITLEGTAGELLIESDGLSDIDAEAITAGTVEIKIDGGGQVLCNLTEELIIDLSGLGTVEASGTATNQEIKIDGGGRVNNFELSADDTNVEMDGLGHVEVNCNNTLDVEIDGGGTVCYRGNPTISQNIDGLGSVNDCN